MQAEIGPGCKCPVGIRHFPAIPNTPVKLFWCCDLGLTLVLAGKKGETCTVSAVASGGRAGRLPQAWKRRGPPTGTASRGRSHEWLVWGAGGRPAPAAACTSMGGRPAWICAGRGRPAAVDCRDSQPGRCDLRGLSHPHLLGRMGPKMSHRGSTISWLAEDLL